MKVQSDNYYEIYTYLANNFGYSELSIEGKLQLIEEIHRDIVFDMQEKRNG